MTRAQALAQARRELASAAARAGHAKRTPAERSARARELQRRRAEKARQRPDWGIFPTASGRWYARVGGRHLGTFGTAEEARRVRDEAVRQRG